MAVLKLPSGAGVAAAVGVAAGRGTRPADADRLAPGAPMKGHAHGAPPDPLTRLTGARAETLAVTGLSVLTVLAEWPLLHGRVVAGLDSLTQFYPWYQLLGETLAAGRLPGWNPHSLSGTPFAANPLSGWTYLPAMLAFTLLPLTPAVVAYQLAHVLLATLAAYALARVLGLGRLGAALAGVAYGQSGPIAVNAACCFAFASVGAWLPLLLLGAELAIRAAGWPGRVRGWSLAGLALSQILASWLGQGSYYALLVLASFVTYRIAARAWRHWGGGGAMSRDRADQRAGAEAGRLVAGRLGSFSRRPPRIAGVRARRAALARGLLAEAGWLGLHGLVPVTLGVGLAAAGLLPRVELNALSSLAGGYAPEDLNVGGWSSAADWRQLVVPGFWFAGWIVVMLAGTAALRVRRWSPGWYLLGLGAVLSLLATPGPTPLHDLFGLLPGFARLHPHLPDRIMTVFFLVPALLAGAGVGWLLATRRLGPLVAVLLILATFLELRLARELAFVAYGGDIGVHTLLPVDLDAYAAPTPAARFLQERLAEDGPFRFLGYGPDPGDLAYTQRFSRPGIVALGVNNRAVWDRLLDVQGYDAVHLARFDAYLRRLNGVGQNYHNADVFAGGLRSPLLDLLAARYLITPAALAGTPADPARHDPSLRVVFEDGSVRVLENREAFPWAWVVHETRPASAEEARDLLAGGAVDPRRTALLEPPLRSPVPWIDQIAAVTALTPGKPVPLALDVCCTVGGESAPHFASLARGEEGVGTDVSQLRPGEGSRGTVVCSDDAARVTVFEPDRLVVRVETAADGVLVLSEVAYPGWQATVDGVAAPLSVANGLFRAVPVPAGAHVVELRFESAAPRLGTLVSAMTAGLLLLVNLALPLVGRGAGRA